jgi:hypothetical protein
MLPSRAMPEPRDEKQPFREGPCAGGPMHGKRLQGWASRIVIAVEINGEPGFRPTAYIWNADVQMWIWEG